MHAERKTMETEEKILTKTLINHVNCKVVAIPSIMRVVVICTDDETLDRCNNAFRLWFSKMRVYKNLRRIIIYFDDQYSYDAGLAIFASSKLVLMSTEPEKMLETDELPEESLERIFRYLKHAIKGGM